MHTVLVFGEISAQEHALLLMRREARDVKVVNAHVLVKVIADVEAPEAVMRILVIDELHHT